jgi:hypothetical protein
MPRASAPLGLVFTAAGMCAAALSQRDAMYHAAHRHSLCMVFYLLVRQGFVNEGSFPSPSVLRRAGARSEVPEEPAPYLIRGRVSVRRCDE